ncbi:site-specific integrase [Frankia sp. AgB1.9]|uniref:site-specific integrase n=1 Tax=unclassified Frankia TaxID=2632575 RepID=UPI001931B6A9|nr:MULTISPECIES: site-specific integrase [unclassified Frankia]MBL7486513.1 site-specific integrase [Frankia sp. AgW1.1]MBL7554022.1 site-specific integrase [Frankia sp. AgB1.9]MBL7618212.1 site-specific integrase [Frankia sp. AgB1.8]
MDGTIYKRCGCRDDAGRQLGTRCPKLRRSGGAWRGDHGAWAYQVDLPPTPGGRRQLARRTGLASQTAAQDDVDRIRTLIAIADPDDTATRLRIAELILQTLRTNLPLPEVADIQRRYQRRADLSPTITVGEWLTTWLTGRRKIATSTTTGYEVNIRLHLIPAIGHIRLDRLSVTHLDDMFDAIDARNDTIRRIRATGTPTEKKALQGRRVMGAANKQRIRATLRAALNHAIRLGLIAHNPAKFVELASGKRPKALLWIEERVLHWQKTGQVPSPVMVWTPIQVGAFLDHAETDDLYALYHLIAHRGLRRGEACGLHWADLDLTHGSLTVRWQIVQEGKGTQLKKPKSDAGDRQIPLDIGTVRALREHRTRQNARRLEAGPGWPDTGLVFVDEAGASLNPDHVTDRFRALQHEAGLPPIRLHDLRHAAATLALAAGADLKAVQELLGHSSITITADTYTHVLPELAREIAENVARLIPRNKPPRDEQHGKAS